VCVVSVGRIHGGSRGMNSSAGSAVVPETAVWMSPMEHFSKVSFVRFMSFSFVLNAYLFTQSSRELPFFV